MTHRPELDAVRGVAVLMVVAYHGLYWNIDASHATGLAWVVFNVARLGWLGVHLFFILSGFLISGILRASRDRPDYYQRFYWRRALRILPPYVLTLGVLAVTGLAQRAFLTTSALFAANFVTFLGVPMQYGPLWSLAVEEQFYLVWPTAVRRMSDRGIALLAGAIVIGVLGARLVAARLGFSDTQGFPWYYTWFVADGLAIGALLAMVDATQLRRIALWALTLGTLALPLTLFRATKILPWELVFVGVIAFALTRHWKAPKVLVFMGQISYGLYLCHMLVFMAYDGIVARFAPNFIAAQTSNFSLVLVRFAVAGAAAVAIATLSRFTYEEAFLRLKDRPPYLAVPAA